MKNTNRKRISEILPYFPMQGKCLAAYIADGATSVEDDKAIAHALTHVDALADALELMAQHNWHPAQFRREAESVAAKALAAYRGEK